MCIGIPMQVIASHPHHAVCQDAKGIQTQIDTMLVGQLKTGSWVLTFLNTAREVISEQRARETQNAIDALEVAMQGNNIDHLFADLIDREPELPEFLRPTKKEP